MKATFTCLLSIWILCGSLMPLNDMEELVKIPDLIHHFKEHQLQEGGSLSFSKFLAEHYNNHPSSQNDKEHKRLPFFEHQCLGLIFLIPAFHFTIQAISNFVSLNFLPYNGLSTLAFSGAHWQPPRSF